MHSVRETKTLLFPEICFWIVWRWVFHTHPIWSDGFPTLNTKISKIFSSTVQFLLGMFNWARFHHLKEQFDNIPFYVDTNGRCYLLWGGRKPSNKRMKILRIPDSVFTWFPRTKYRQISTSHLLLVLPPGEQPCNCVLIFIRANRSSSTLTWHLQCSKRQLRHVWPLARSFPVIDI